MSHDLQQRVYIGEEVVSETAATVNRFVFLANFFFAFEQFLDNDKSDAFYSAERCCLLEVDLKFKLQQVHVLAVKKILKDFL